MLPTEVFNINKVAYLKSNSEFTDQVHSVVPPKTFKSNCTNLGLMLQSTQLPSIPLLLLGVSSRQADGQETLWGDGERIREGRQFWEIML